jgi:rhodanese-related sulfurtransferase
MSARRLSHGVDPPIPLPDFMPESDDDWGTVDLWQSRSQEVCLAKDVHDPFPLLQPAKLRDWMTDPLSHPYTNLVIIDARFEYEFRGGHVRGARNVRSMSDLKGVYNRNQGDNTVVVFHCEFSRNRGPTLMRAFRELDRKENLDRYPHLSYPHVYLLDGGYRRFFQDFPDQCTGGYIQMRDAEYVKNGELRKSHSFYQKTILGSESRRRFNSRASTGALDFVRSSDTEPEFSLCTGFGMNGFMYSSSQ